jgi:hypothetical protein
MKKFERGSRLADRFVSECCPKVHKVKPLKPAT